MPIIKSAVKRMKQTRVKNERNVATKKAIKLATKAFIAQPSAETLSATYSALDTAVKKNVLPKKRVAHRKAALAKIAKDAGVKFETKKTAQPAAKPATKAAAKKPVAKTTASKTTKATTTTKKPAAKKSASKPATKK